MFELAHTDILCPYRVPTHRGYRYFMTLIDDKSRATWVYLMKHKSQALSILETFSNYIGNQFQSTMKILRTENALEFESQPCLDFFDKFGIVHQTTFIDRA